MEDCLRAHNAPTSRRPSRLLSHQEAPWLSLRAAARGPGGGRGGYLLGAALDAAVLAGHVLAVPVVGSAAREAQVGVALAHGQVARTLLRVALSFAAAAGEAVLTFGRTFLVTWKPCGTLTTGPHRVPPPPPAQTERKPVKGQEVRAVTTENNHH